MGLSRGLCQSATNSSKLSSVSATKALNARQVAEPFSSQRPIWRITLSKAKASVRLIRKIEARSEVEMGLGHDVGGKRSEVLEDLPRAKILPRTAR